MAHLVCVVTTGGGSVTPEEATKAMDNQEPVRLCADLSAFYTEYPGDTFRGTFLIAGIKRIGSFLVDVEEIDAVTVTGPTGTFTWPLAHLELVPPLPTAPGLGSRGKRKMRI